MTLTRPPGPLSRTGGQRTNYRIEGPQHRLLWHRFPGSSPVGIPPH